MTTQQWPDAAAPASPPPDQWMKEAEVRVETLIFAIEAKDCSGDAARKFLLAHLALRPPAQPLTDEQIMALWPGDDYGSTHEHAIRSFARAIEAALKKEE